MTRPDNDLLPWERLTIPWWCRTWGRYIDLTRPFARTRPRRAQLLRALSHLQAAVRRDMALAAARRAS